MTDEERQYKISNCKYRLRTHIWLLRVVSWLVAVFCAAIVLTSVLSCINTDGEHCVFLVFMSFLFGFTMHQRDVLVRQYSTHADILKSLTEDKEDA